MVEEEKKPVVKAEDEKTPDKITVRVNPKTYNAILEIIEFKKKNEGLELNNSDVVRLAIDSLHADLFKEQAPQEDKVGDMASEVAKLAMENSELKQVNKTLTDTNASLVDTNAKLTQRVLDLTK